MAKSKKQPVKPEKEERFDFQESREKSLVNADSDAGMSSRSSGEKNETEQDMEDVPLSRPKGMDAWLFHCQKLFTMQEIIQQLINKAGLSQDQATKAIQVIGQFVKDKYPMAGGYVDNFLGKGGGEKGAGNPLKNFLG